MQQPSGSCPRPCPRRLLVLLLALGAGGCQSYAPRPVDLEAHRQSFLTRTPETVTASDFARSLGGAEASPPADFNPGDGLSVAEAEAVAMVYSAELRIARLEAGVTRAAADNAGLWEDPTIGVDLARIVENVPNPWKVFSSVGLTLPISGRLEVEKQKAGVEHAAQLARVAQAEWGTRIALRRAWAHWSALDAALQVTRDFIERVDQVVAIVDAMERAGEIARTESRLFQIERARRAAELDALDADAAVARLEILRLMGLAPAAPATLVPWGLEVSDAGGSSVDLEAAAIERSPLLLVARADYQAAEHALKLEVQRQYPDLHVGPGYGNEDGDNQVLLGVSLPVPIFNANRRAIAEADAAREVARARLETSLEQLMADLATARARHDAALRRRDALENQIVPMVDRQYADAREIARLGEVNTLIILESLTRQQQAKVDLITAQRDQALAAIRIEEIVGPVHTERSEVTP